MLDTLFEKLVHNYKGKACWRLIHFPPHTRLQLYLRKVAGTSLGIAYIVKMGGEGSHRTRRVVSG